jgi:hypothetical protein
MLQNITSLIYTDRYVQYMDIDCYVLKRKPWLFSGFQKNFRTLWPLFCCCKHFALGYGLYDQSSGVRFPARGLGIFLFATASRTPLGTTHTIQWVLGTLSLGVRRPGREDDHSPPSSSEFKEWVELYLHSSIRLHGMSTVILLHTY